MYINDITITSLLSNPIGPSFPHYAIFLQSDWLSDFEYSHDLVILTCFEYPGPESKNRTLGLTFTFSYLVGMYPSTCAIPFVEHIPENVL